MPVDMTEAYWRPTAGEYKAGDSGGDSMEIALGGTAVVVGECTPGGAMAMAVPPSATSVQMGQPMESMMCTWLGREGLQGDG